MELPKQPKRTDRKQLEKQVKTLGEQIGKAQRNLTLLEPENIPAVQEEIRRMKTEREQL